MSNFEDIVSAEKLANGLWVWICQPDSGAFFQGPQHYKRKGDAVKAGVEFAQALPR